MLFNVVGVEVEDEVGAQRLFVIFDEPLVVSDLDIFQDVRRVGHFGGGYGRLFFGGAE